MKTSWTQGLTKDQSSDIRRDFNGSALLRRRLAEMLVSKSDSLRKKVRSELSYDNPNWAYLQADALGYERAIFDIISMISDDTVEKSEK